MSYADQLRAAVSEPDWSILQHMASLAAQLSMPLYMVGGPVRDCMLRRTITDLDLTTEGDAAALARTVTHNLGGTWKRFNRFGTAKLHLPGRASPIDLATTRTETYAQPGALPDVARGDLQSDLVRRDFTINAMAIRLDSEYQGELIDLHGGERDLQAGVLRVLHARSFTDDPTRLFRGARFEQRFGFTLAADTRPLIESALPVIHQVSGDRLRHELELIFCEEQPANALARLDEWGVLRYLDPEIVIDQWIADRFRAQAALYDRLACWVWLTCRLSQASLTRFSQRVNLARADAVAVAQAKAVWDAQETIGTTERRSELYRRLIPYSDRALRVALTAIDDPAARQNTLLFLNELSSVRPAIDGHRLQELGVPRGPQVRRILEQVRGAMLDGVIATPQQEEEYARQLLAHEGYHDERT
jgi:tRNA nucleotidyltransferase (CCA-adding enzyme)